MTDLLEETPEAIQRFSRLLDQNPIQEPANGGPTDEEFSNELANAARDILTAPEMFPDPSLTAARYEIKR